MKRMMLALTMAVLCGCTISKVGGHNWPSEKENENQNSVDIENTVFMSAVVFPDGYDWQKDSVCLSEGSRLVMLGGERILCESEAKSEFHYMVKGSLFETLVDNMQTIVRQDGQECLRWDGQESIWDLAMDGKDILCLCVYENEDGYGCRLRRNGKSIWHQDGCYPTSDFYENKGTLCFGLDGEFAGGVQGTEETLFSTAELPFSNINYRFFGNDRWLLCGYEGFACVSSSLGGPYSSYGENLFCGLLYDGSGVYVEQYRDGAYCILKDFTVLYSCENFRREAVVIDGDDICALGRVGDDYWAVFSKGLLTTLPAGCTPIPGAGMALSYGRLMFPVTLEGGVAGFWDGGQVRSLGLNGYVDRIRIGRGVSKKYWMSK